MIDMNYYFLRHAVTRRQAAEAASVEARIAHEQLADAYRRLIELEQRRRGASQPFVDPFPRAATDLAEGRTE